MFFKALTLASLAAVGVKAQGGFAQSCSDIRMVCPSFGGECPEGPGNQYLLIGDCYVGGKQQEAIAVLNQFFGNVHGHLVGAGGGFAQTCRNCGLGGTVLTCDCGDGGGGWPQTSINLNTFCTNDQGQIKCAT